MGTTILDSIKKLLGINLTDVNFDDELLIYINGIFMTLHQLGVGPTEVFSISDPDTEWDSFMESATDLEAVKSYIYLKVRLLFDPPQNSFLVSTFEKQIQELEWRLNLQKEPYTLTAEAEAAAALLDDEEVIF